MSSSSSSSAVAHHVLPQDKYDVFLSFRGPDTRQTFTEDLYRRLTGKEINTYIDNRLEAGDGIKHALVAAIEQSKISIIILSENYASSSWCLDELVHILKCMRTNGQIVLPVFYKIEPSVVRYQLKSYADAFVKHEERFKNDKDKLEKVLIWRDALLVAADLSGYESQNQKYRPESVLVDTIVQFALGKLEDISATESRGLRGMESQVQQIELLLSIQEQDVRSIGIWGMGGLGKTTLAYEVFLRLSSEFESCSFVINVREELKKYGIQHVREKLEKSLDIGSQLSPKKVLVVLDDVSSSSQIEAVLGDKLKFGSGSRIIITSRDKSSLTDRVKNKHIHPMKGLRIEDARQVIYSTASRDELSETEFLDLSRRAADIAKGFPLVLKLMSSELGYCKTRKDWEDVLNRWQNVPNKKIEDVLLASYTGLQEDHKAIFLDIACFFRGEKRGKAERILQMHRFSAGTGVQILIDKSLVSISDGNLEMHDLLQEMGRSIVREQCADNSGKRSRLWDAKDIYKVLKNKMGTTILEAICLNISTIQEIQLSPKAFKNMHNLWLLRFYAQPNMGNDASSKTDSDKDVDTKLHLPEGLKFLPDDLRYLYWESYPSRSLPSKFSPHNLVELHLPNGKVKKLWNNKGQNLMNLKRLNLKGCEHLTEVLDFSQCPNIETLILSGCKGLDQLHVNKLAKLTTLKISGCWSLKSYPKMPCNVQNLDLSYSELTEVPDLSGCLNLKKLYLNHCEKLVQLPNGYLKHHAKLTTLNMAHCSSLKTSPEIPCSLRTLDLSSCSQLTEVPDLSKCPNIEEIDLCRCTSLVQLPSSIFKNLDKVSRLLLAKCSNLEVCPELPRNILELNLSSCSRLTGIPDLSKCPFIKEIDLCRCTGLVQLPTSIFKNLDKIKRLLLAKCTSLKFCPELPRSIELLDLSSCSRLTEVPDISACSNLVELDLCHCTRLVHIPYSYVRCLDKLTTLSLKDCSSLKAIPKVPQNVRHLYAPGCSKVAEFPDISECSKIERIDLSDCTSLVHVPKYVRDLDFFQYPDVKIKLRGCTSLNPPAPPIIRKSV